MNKYFNYLIVFLFVCACGHQPIFSGKRVNFGIKNIKFDKNNNIEVRIDKILNNYKDLKSKNKIIDLEISSKVNKTITSKDKNGDPESYKLELIVEAIVKENNKIINIVDDLKDLEENAEIIGKINWDLRYKHMRMHTALHLLCSIVPLGVTGGQIGYEKSRLDFNDPDKQINKEELEEKINLLVEDNHTVTSEVIESSILEEKPELVRTMSVKPPQVDGKIRLIRIGDIDLQPCGGTHVKSTNEIGKIQIGKIENKGKMNRRVNLLLSS